MRPVGVEIGGELVQDDPPAASVPWCMVMKPSRDDQLDGWTRAEVQPASAMMTAITSRTRVIMPNRPCGRGGRRRSVISISMRIR